MKYALTQYGEDNDGLSPEMRIAAEIMAIPGRAGMTIEQIAQQARTSPRTINRWRQDPRFAEYVKQRATMNISEHLPDVYAALLEKAKTGSSIKSIEIFLRAAGVLNSEFTVRPAPPVEDRSDAFIEAEIERLKRELGEITNDNEEEK